jgi:hypothetical protein
VDAIRRNGYAYTGAQPCAACVDGSIDESGACEAVIGCLANNYPCSGNCSLQCANSAGATTAVDSCVTNLVNASCGGTSTGSGGSGGGGQSGTGPCAGLCSNPTALTAQSATEMNTPAGACYSTTFSIQGATCTNATSFRVNGVAEPCTGTSLSLPAKIMGGYCFQFGTGDPTYSLVATY